MDQAMSLSADLLLEIQQTIRNPDLSDEQVAQALAGLLKHSDRPVGDKIGQELQGLMQLIRQTRDELASLRQASAAGAAHLPSASDELDAVVGATEDATNQIMTCAEEIGAIGTEVGGTQGQKLEAIMTRLFEACSFQDITGQRITKVVRALKTIDEHLSGLIGTFGLTLEAVDKPPAAKGDAALMNGPQMPGSATSQDEIDALLSSFDAP